VNPPTNSCGQKNEGNKLATERKALIYGAISSERIYIAKSRETDQKLLCRGKRRKMEALIWI
jgi:hypothetical protein